ncbi:hypothetical protein GCK32_005659 [Trichostrongylus colubriformis]|uniref:Uncharacterized protein n=1 Tax=Trichostrongylus colubriformis TaxID=6319 RepID=A0AAN8IRM8_TRICO
MRSRSNQNEKEQNRSSRRRSSRKKKAYDTDDSKDEDESSKHTEEDRPPIRFYGDEPTRWTIADTDVDPIYVRDTDSATSFVPLPRAESDSRPSTDPRIEEHFIGVRSSEEAGKMVKPDDFVLYYRRDNDAELDIGIPLYLAHRNTRNKIFHFPIIRSSTEENGAKWWQVQISCNMAHTFRQLSDLVRCYHLYRFTDARTGRMEVFPLWKGGILDDYK